MEEKIKCPKCDNLTSKFYVEIDGMCWQCKKKKDLRLSFKEYCLKQDLIYNDSIIHLFILRANEKELFKVAETRSITRKVN